MQPARAPAPAAFTPEEVSEVLSRYELGSVGTVRELLGAGTGSPKALVECARGRFVLKRRAPGRDNPFRVAFSHEVMLALRARGYPAPELVGTRADNNSLVQLEGRVYELFAFVDARPFARHPGQARDAGLRLSELHALLGAVRTSHPEPPDRPDPAATVRRAADAVAAPEAGARVEGLFAETAGAITAAGGPPGASGLIHGDWHPGNMLFVGERVDTVFDFDGVRRAPLADDVALALTQFSMVRAEGGPGAWPAEPDTGLARAFFEGYREGPASAGVAPASWPLRMARSLVTEWGEGVVGGILGDPGAASAMLGAVERKARWLVEHAPGFAAELGG